MQKSFVDQAQDPVGGSAQEFSKLVHEDTEKFSRLVKELNVKVN